MPTQRPLPPKIGNENWDTADNVASGGRNGTVSPRMNSLEDNRHVVWPAGIVKPDDPELAAELARRIVAAGLHRWVVILGHADGFAWFVNFGKNRQFALSLSIFRHDSEFHVVGVCRDPNHWRARDGT